MCQRPPRVGPGDVIGHQHIVWHIKPIKRGVLRQVAKNIGQLKSLAKRNRDRFAQRIIDPEHPIGKSANRAGHPIAIILQRPNRGHPHTFRRIDLHPFYDRKESRFAHAEPFGRVHQGKRHRICRSARIQPFDLNPPIGQPVEFFDRCTGVIGDIVHLAAKRIHSVHGLTLAPGQKPHRPIKGSARSAYNTGGVINGLLVLHPIRRIDHLTQCRHSPICRSGFDDDGP